MARKAGVAHVRCLIEVIDHECFREPARVAARGVEAEQNSDGIVMNLSSSSCPAKLRPDLMIPTEEEQPEVRVEKVLEIRRQLGEGTYSITDRLDAVIERIINDLG